MQRFRYYKARRSECNDSVITKRAEANAERLLAPASLSCPSACCSVDLPGLLPVLSLSAAPAEGILLAVPCERRGLLYPAGPPLA